MPPYMPSSTNSLGGQLQLGLGLGLGLGLLQLGLGLLGLGLGLVFYMNNEHPKAFLLYLVLMMVHVLKHIVRFYFLLEP